MRRFLLAGALFAGLSGLAHAADLSYPAPSTGAGPMVAPTFNWAGPYLGAQIGGGWMNVDRLTSGGFANSYNGSGFVGGLFLGYNWLAPNGIVWGVEADANLANISGNDAGVGGTTDGTRINWDGTINGRVGKAFGRALLYLSGGLAVAGVSQTNSSTALTGPSTLYGWNIGGGLDFALTSDVFGRVDFKHKAYGAAAYTGAGLANFTTTTTANEVTVGIAKVF